MNSRDKIKFLFEIWPAHTIATTSWLRSKGFLYTDLSGYEKSGWIFRIGHGAFKRERDGGSWEGAVYGLQNQFPNQFHLGGRSAFEVLGSTHFLSFGQFKLHIFAGSKRHLPGWFSTYMNSLAVPFHYFQYMFLPTNMGVMTHDFGEFTIEISTKERAALEMLGLLEKLHDFEECRLIFENLSSLRPPLVQELLENCTSVKAKRAFLFLSKNLGHKWFHDLDLSRIDLGSGPREIVKNGVYDHDFEITYPSGFFDDESLSI